MTQAQRRIRKAASTRSACRRIRAMIEARRIAYFDDLGRVVESYRDLPQDSARSPRDEKDKEPQP